TPSFHHRRHLDPGEEGGRAGQGGDRRGGHRAAESRGLLGGRGGPRAARSRVLGVVRCGCPGHGGATVGVASDRGGGLPAAPRGGRAVRAASHEVSVPGARADEADGEGGCGMGKASAETLREIEQTRERLDTEVREFQRRLPAPAVWAKRAAGLAVGGGAGGTLFWFAVRRARGRKRAKRGDKPQVQAVV